MFRIELTYKEGRNTVRNALNCDKVFLSSDNSVELHQGIRIHKVKNCTFLKVDGDVWLEDK